MKTILKEAISPLRWSICTRKFSRLALLFDLNLSAIMGLDHGDSETMGAMWLCSVSKCPVPCAGSAVILRPVGEAALQRTGYSSLVRFIYSVYRLVPSAPQPPRPCSASFCVLEKQKKNETGVEFSHFSFYFVLRSMRIVVFCNTQSVNYIKK